MAAPMEVVPEQKEEQKAVNLVKPVRLSKPNYHTMLLKALSVLNETRRSVASVAAVSKYIIDNYPVNPKVFKLYLKRALKNALKDREIVQVRRSFKIAPKRLQRKNKKQQIEKNNRKKLVDAKRNIPNKEVVAKASEEKKPQAPKKSKRASDSATPSALPNAPVKVSGLKYDHVWQFYDKSRGGWLNYDLKASDIVEEIYQKYLANRGDTDVRAVRSGEWEYQVDFLAMKQMNIQHENHTVRNIRRVSVAKN